MIVRRSRTRQSGVANGVKFGTASVGSFRRILIEDVTIEHAQAAAMAVESVDGARSHCAAAQGTIVRAQSAAKPSESA